jgi:hypothetical protein
MKTYDLPALEQFFGCYFHQDWVDEFSTSEQAVSAFKIGSAIEDINSVCEELGRLLLLPEQGEELQNVLRELGCYYNPAAVGLTIPGWLEQLQENLNCNCTND